MDVLDIGDLSFIVRRSAARLGKVAVVMPDAVAITDTPGSLNSMNVVNPLGLPIPTAAPTLATTDVGTGNISFTNYPQAIGYYVTFWDDNTQTEGNPVYCGTVNITSASNVNIDLTTITNEGTNTRVTHCKIYRNLLATGTTFFPVAKVAVASMGSVYKDSVTNATAAASSPTLATDNFGPQLGAPPGTSTFGIAVSQSGYMVLAGAYNALGGTAYDDAYIVSKLNTADAYPSNNLNYVAPGRHGIIRAVATQGDSFVFYKDSCIGVLRFVVNPAILGGDGSLKIMNETRGAVNNECVVNLDGIHYVLDQKGIYVTANGSEANEIGQGLEDFFNRINWTPTVAQWFTATYTEDAIYWFVALDGDTVPHHAFVLNLTAIRSGRGVRWWVHRYLHGITGSTRYWTGGGTAAVAHRMAGEWRSVVSTQNGYFFILGCGFRDGLHPYLLAEGTIKTDSTPTTTGCTLNESGTISYTNATTSLTSTLVGCYVLFPDSEMSGEITAQAAGPPIALTYSTLPRAPSADERVWIGAFPEVVYYTPDMDFMERDILKAGDVILEFEPRILNHQIGVGFVKNGNQAPETLQTVSSGTGQDGLETVADQSLIDVDMGGAYQQQGARGFRVLSPAFKPWYSMAVLLDASGVDKPALIERIQVEPRRAN